MNGDWWKEAGREFCRRLDAHERRDPAKPDWQYLNFLALDHENFPRVLAEMSLRQRLATFPRGQLSAWPNSDGPVHLFMHGTDGILVDSGSGRWRTRSGNARGRDLIALGAFMWSCSYGRSAWRIAQICGHDRVPDGSWRRNHA